MSDTAPARGAHAPRDFLILGLCGSLRAASLNALLLRAIARLSIPGVRVQCYPTLGTLPLFNPDQESPAPASVDALRTAIKAADALLIASPEYAHGITGVLKNALDWMVGNESFVNKPVALLNASPRATHAQQALRETLSTMCASLVEDACVAVPLLGSELDEQALVHHPQIAAQLRQALRCLAESRRERGD